MVIRAVCIEKNGVEVSFEKLVRDGAPPDEVMDAVVDCRRRACRLAKQLSELAADPPDLSTAKRWAEANI